MLTQFPDIDDVPVISERDLACLKDLKGVLARYGFERRFGVTLLHQHFNVDHDEILLEVCDSDQRILTIKPVKQHTLATVQSRPTNWRLDTEVPTMNCVCVVVNGQHSGRHHSNK